MELDARIYWPQAMRASRVWPWIGPRRISIILIVERVH